ncbi:hypothetical protein H5410_049233 [Solanum commersonii]|uniref:Uncharacterized protein n=1 Tax=Solanum commersonii TaxID=4109 RepID=A0A9J5XMV0_SOLCO|nr:hypothetical protein H5410_049233 [Solanum commersonii]
MVKYGKIFSLKFGYTPIVVVSSAKLAKPVLKTQDLSKKIQSFSPIREDEVSRMIKKISQQAASSQITNLSRLMISLTSTIICRVAFGVRFDEEAHERKSFDYLLAEAQAMMATIFVSAFFLFLSWIDKLTGLTDRLERNFKNLNEFYEELIEQH